MTVDDIQSLARMYDEAIRCSSNDIVGRSIPSIDRSAVLDRPSPNRSDFFLEHGRWMCHQMQIFSDLEKMNRWLGFVQYILVENHVFKLEEIREHVRRFDEHGRNV